MAVIILYPCKVQNILLHSITISWTIFAHKKRIFTVTINHDRFEMIHVYEISFNQVKVMAWKYQADLEVTPCTHMYWPSLCQVRAKLVTCANCGNEDPYLTENGLDTWLLNLVNLEGR